MNVTWSLRHLVLLRGEPREPPPQIRLAQDQEIQHLMARFQATKPNGAALQQLEVLVRRNECVPPVRWRSKGVADLPEAIL